MATANTQIRPDAVRWTPTLAWDLANVTALRDELQSRLASGVLRLDLSAVTDIDLAGLQLLWAARRLAQETGAHFSVLAPSPAVQSAATAFGLELAALEEQP